MEEWAGEKGLDVAAVMTAHTDGDGRFVRELLVWGFNAAAVKVAKRFGEGFAKELGLEPWQGGKMDLTDEKSGQWRRCWRQHALGASRKQVGPMLRETMRDEKGSSA